MAAKKTLEVQELLQALEWIAMFAVVRSQDDSKVFARVNRGAMRTIAEKARAAVERAEGRS